MRRQTLCATAFALCAISATANAEQFRLKVGYFSSDQFSLRDASRGHIESPEVGVDLALAPFGPKGNAYLMVSSGLGSRYHSSAKAAGSVYRFQIGTRVAAAGGITAISAIGVATVQSTHGTFSGVTGYDGSVGFGLPILGGSRTKKPASLDVIYHYSNKGAIRGAYVGFSIGF